MGVGSPIHHHDAPGTAAGLGAGPCTQRSRDYPIDVPAMRTLPGTNLRCQEALGSYAAGAKRMQLSTRSCDRAVMLARRRSASEHSTVTKSRRRRVDGWEVRLRSRKLFGPFLSYLFYRKENDEFSMNQKMMQRFQWVDYGLKLGVQFVAIFSFSL